MKWRSKMDRQMDKYDESDTQTIWVFYSQRSCQLWNLEKLLNFNIYSSARRKALKIFHFRVTLSLFIKARLGAQSFRHKIGLFSCEWKVTFAWKVDWGPRLASKKRLNVIQKWPSVLSAVGKRLEFQGALKLQKNWFWTRQKSGTVPVTFNECQTEGSFYSCSGIWSIEHSFYSQYLKMVYLGSWNFHIILFPPNLLESLSLSLSSTS